LGRVLPDILRIKLRWPIEAVAMRLTTETIREILARPKPENVYAESARTQSVRPVRPDIGIFS
jgi:hypothetical protein